MQIGHLADQGLFPPTDNNMRDLSCSDDLFDRFRVALVFEDEEWVTREQKWTLANHARLTDKAIREYAAASQCLSNFIEAPRAVAAPDRAPNAIPVDAF